MRRLLAPFLACLVAAGAAAETDPLAPWAGTWRGRCELIPPYQGSSGLETLLTIAPGADGSYTWRLVYEASGSVPRQVRDYELVPVDAVKGHYVLDEKNGLKLDTFVVGRAIYSYFMISGNRIPSHDELLSEDEMLMSLPMFEEAPVRNTCLTGKPSVCTDSFRLKTAQSCRLRRQR